MLQYSVASELHDGLQECLDVIQHFEAISCVNAEFDFSMLNVFCFATHFWQVGAY